jgi:alkaline phosphatase D
VLASRRALLAAASVAALPRPAWAQNLAHGVFTHGVASGDPTHDRVIIWTRFVGPNGGDIAWEVAEDDSFTRIAQRGQAEATVATDFCVKVDVGGLAPDRPYFYRFLSGDEPSPTGLTRTAPASGGEALTVALVSCSNFAHGYFHAYAHIASRDDIDLVLHVGDYIYEYGDDEYPRTRDAVPGRLFDPAHEVVTLNDYYQRYAAYHADPDLLALRARKPIASVWDDHEIANQATAGGAQNHQRSEGAYVDRVAAASKAYFDWMPIRHAGARLYRHLDWGSLARILLLDTRIAGRQRQLDYRTALGLRLLQDNARAAAAVEEFRRTQLNDPARTMLGAEQEAWLGETLAQSRQRGQPWQIVAQQVVMGSQIVGEGASALVAESAHSNTRRFVEAGERLGGLGMPWNLDAWDGYPAARARFLQACTANANNAVVLGGDSHNCWLNNLPSESGDRLAAVEFAGGSVTSPGMERAVANATTGRRETMMRSANPHLAWCDVTNRGYGALRFTRALCDAEWVAFADVRAPAPRMPGITRFHSEASAAAGPGGWAYQRMDRAP